jgi:hypothetical protein
LVAKSANRPALPYREEAVRLDERGHGLERGARVGRVVQDALAVGRVEDALLERRMQQVALDRVKLGLGLRALRDADEALGHVERDDLGAEGQRDRAIASHAAARVEHELAREVVRRQQRLLEEGLLVAGQRARIAQPFPAEGLARLRGILGRAERAGERRLLDLGVVPGVGLEHGEL